MTGAPVLPALLTALTATPGASGSGAVLLSWDPRPTGAQPTYYAVIAWSGSYPGYSLFETVDTAGAGEQLQRHRLDAGSRATRSPSSRIMLAAPSKSSIYRICNQSIPRRPRPPRR